MSYWDGYGRKRPPKKVEGIKAKTRLKGETWWSKRWLDLLTSFDLGGRLTRGRTYARQGQVLSLDIQHGRVTAEVQGSASKPYKIKIGLRPLSEADWQKVTGTLATEAIFAAKLLAGEMPQNIEEGFQKAKIPLFPTRLAELETDCSCPDWSNPCKHIAAVYYILAERFDEDPFLIFKLRGRSKEEIVAALRERRGEQLAALAPESAPGNNSVMKPREEVVPIPLLVECLANFWEVGEELSSLKFSIEATSAGGGADLIRRLGNAPFNVAGENGALLLLKAYNLVRKRALAKVED